MGPSEIASYHTTNNPFDTSRHAHRTIDEDVALNRLEEELGNIQDAAKVLRDQLIGIEENIARFCEKEIDTAAELIISFEAEKARKLKNIKALNSRSGSQYSMVELSRTRPKPFGHILEKVLQGRRVGYYDTTDTWEDARDADMSHEYEWMRDSGPRAEELQVIELSEDEPDDHAPQPRANAIRNCDSWLDISAGARHSETRDYLHHIKQQRRRGIRQSNVGPEFRQPRIRSSDVYIEEFIFTLREDPRNSYVLRCPNATEIRATCNGMVTEFLDGGIFTKKPFGRGRAFQHFLEYHSDIFDLDHYPSNESIFYKCARRVCWDTVPKDRLNKDGEGPECGLFDYRPSGKVLELAEDIWEEIKLDLDHDDISASGDEGPEDHETNEGTLQSVPETRNDEDRVIENGTRTVIRYQIIQDTPLRTPQSAHIHRPIPSASLSNSRKHP
ncbi:hypothetical protein PFICI_06120 [Pestalotiopsis fici W106-1]|uniref:Uncharacterized protein n=1 Tax=Pestalotiopsis fici (strain W106-1 / CGMCC3.15140) TaxID=1229662 RepID=W3X4R2_PESFW|nr:uncharacterized protein PFICI_06120 [Pestalotiopsis fici W106-1]ETS81118.1 hypothetical protein PFICI_06120 [Pestalotiopsis fici W106-1]